MQTRHRIPQVFNLSMVDVLCCALGAIILLWLLNSRDAKERAREAGSTRALLNRSEESLAKETKTNRELKRQLEDLASAKSVVETRLIRLTREQADLLRQLAALKDISVKADKELRAESLKLRDLEKISAALKKLSADTVAGLKKRTGEKLELEELLAALKAKNLKDELRLARLTNEQADLLRELAALKSLRVQDSKVLDKKSGQLAALLKELAFLKKVSLDEKDGLRKKALELRDLEKALAALRLLKTDLENRLLASEGKVLVLQKDVRDRKKALTDARSLLLRELDGARASITGLERDKKDLTGRIARIRAEAENRFAGIALTGRRVIFLVDMSGSMELVDEKTTDPAKWVGVRETVAKIMRSLPELEKFQVIVFSDKVAFLLGKGDDWLPYSPETSADRVTWALAAIKPKGGTNMYASIEALFRFRPVGLDTVYFLSDGLPNMGEGLTDEQARTLKENEQSEVLSKYIRKKLKTEWNLPRGGKRVRINTIGFFYESPDVGAFLWALARENDGSFVGMSKP